MNEPIRRLSMLAAMLFSALLVASIALVAGRLGAGFLGRTAPQPGSRTGISR